MGAQATGAGLGIMGGILGGVGDIIQAQNYHKPHLEPATGREKRLRDLAQSQLIGGGQQLLGGTALYNSMVPMLMSQLPGMHYVPGTSGGGDMGGGGSAAQQQLTQLKANRRAAKGKPAKRDARQAVKAQKQLIKGMPTVAERERQMYTAGTQQPNMDIYNIHQGAPPSQDSTLASIRGMMDSLQQRPDSPDLAAIYNRGGGYG
jgi:hypothetical protein